MGSGDCHEDADAQEGVNAGVILTHFAAESPE